MTEIAWLDCPYGRINDPYPGQCGLYVDTNENQVCDHSEPPSAGVAEVAGGVGDMKNFVLWSSFVVLALYFVHWYFAHKTKVGEKFKFLNRAFFRYFWNLVLLITFIPVAVSGLLWAFGVTNFDFNLWHNRAGLVFTFVAVLHLLKRFRHFTRIPRASFT